MPEHLSALFIHWALCWAAQVKTLLSKSPWPGVGQAKLTGTVVSERRELGMGGGTVRVKVFGWGEVLNLQSPCLPLGP